MLCTSTAYAVMRHLSACPSIRHVRVFCHIIKIFYHLIKIFSPSGSHTILLFPHQTLWQYSDGDPSNEGVDCRWGRQKSRFSTDIWLHRMLTMVRLPNFMWTAVPDHGKLVTLSAGKWHCLFAEVYDKTTKQY